MTSMNAMKDQARMSWGLFGAAVVLSAAACGRATVVGNAMSPMKRLQGTSFPTRAAANMS